MSEYQTCPHPRETWQRETALYSSVCPDCKARACYDCHRFGSKDFMIPLVSWMTGTCDDCYRERERRAKVRKDYYADKAARESKRRVWDEGYTAGHGNAMRRVSDEPNAPTSPNPYAEPAQHSWETVLLEQHDWLREEVGSDA